MSAALKRAEAKGRLALAPHNTGQRVLPIASGKPQAEAKLAKVSTTRRKAG
jgi:hypothetical protein